MIKCLSLHYGPVMQDHNCNQVVPGPQVHSWVQRQRGTLRPMGEQGRACELDQARALVLEGALPLTSRRPVVDTQAVFRIPVDPW